MTKTAKAHDWLEKEPIGAIKKIELLTVRLPGITTNFLVSQAEKFGLKNLQFKVIHVGWQRLDLADVTAGDAADPALRIPDLSIEYSLTGLWRKKIKNIRLVGAWIKIEDRGQGFHFPGMITPPPESHRGQVSKLEVRPKKPSILHYPALHDFLGQSFS